MWRGLGNKPPGSRGTPSRPRRTKLLDLPLCTRAAQGSGSSAAICKKSCGKGIRLPVTLVASARISTVPERPSAEEALTRLVGSARNASAVDQDVAPLAGEGIGTDRGC